MLTREDGSPIYIPWDIEYEDGSRENGFKVAWDDQIAENRSTHGVQLLFTKKKIVKLSLYLETCLYYSYYRCQIVPPTPRPCFSFARMAQPVTDEPTTLEWRYSAFGYELDDGSLFLMDVLPWRVCRSFLIPPNEPFPL